MWCRIAGLGLLLLSAVSLAKPLIMGGDVDPPLKWIDEQGNTVGIEIDLLTQIYQQMPDLVPEFEFKVYQSSTRAKQEIKDGSIDQYITMSIKPERLAYLTYPSESHLNIKWVFFATKEFLDSEKYAGREVVFNRYEDLKPYRLGATEGYAYSDEFWQAVNDKTLKVEVLQKNILSIKKLLKGRIDLFPSYQFKMQWNAQKDGYADQITYLPKPIRDKDYYNPFSKASSHPNVKNGKVIQRYSEVLQKLKKDGTVKKILQKYGIE